MPMADAVPGLNSHMPTLAIWKQLEGFMPGPLLVLGPKVGPEGGTPRAAVVYRGGSFRMPSGRSFHSEMK